MTDIPDPELLTSHYSDMASTYDGLWDMSPEFDWVIDETVRICGLQPGQLVLDVGGGTGMYAAALADAVPGLRVVVVDPSEQMLSKVPPLPTVSTLRSHAEEAVDLLHAAGIDSASAVLIKGAIHHFSDMPGSLRSLSGFLAPGGSIVVGLIEQQLRYPLFDAAVARFAQLQPDPAEIADLLADCGMEVSRQKAEFIVELSTERWLQLVQSRFMSVLSTFTDEELAQGVEETRGLLRGQDTMEFHMHLVLIHGWTSSGR